MIARFSSSLLSLALYFLGALSVLSLNAPGVAWGQEGRRKPLPELRSERNKAIQTYTDTGAELTNLERRLAGEAKSLDAANARVREAEADGGPFASAEVKRRRRQARKIANRKASLMLMKAQVSPRHEFERLAMIEARSALARRLLEVVHRLTNQVESEVRSSQIKKQTEEALGELKAIAAHRKVGKRGSDLGRPVPPLGPDADTEEMEWRLKAYRRQIKAGQGHLKALKPRETRLLEHVKHLDRLLKRGYALPDLAKTLARERGELARVQGLLQEIDKQTSYYQKLAVQLQDRLGARRSRESGDKE